MVNGKWPEGNWTNWTNWTTWTNWTRWIPSRLPLTTYHLPSIPSHLPFTIYHLPFKTITFQAHLPFKTLPPSESRNPARYPGRGTRSRGGSLLGRFLLRAG